MDTRFFLNKYFGVLVVVMTNTYASLKDRRSAEINRQKIGGESPLLGKG